jgi:hypothetical protein
MLGVEHFIVMLNVIMFNIVMLSVVAPCREPLKRQKGFYLRKIVYFSITDIIVTLSISIECQNAECCIFTVILNIIIFIINMLSVVAQLRPHREPLKRQKEAFI